MSTTIIKGKIEDDVRSEIYDAEGNKIIAYRIKVNGNNYTCSFPERSAFYFENQMEVLLQVNEDKVAVAGICPKAGYKWGHTAALKKEATDTDRFELAEGVVLEKRKEVFTVNRGTARPTDYSSNFRYVTTYTIVLPEKRFRVADIIGKKVKPGTEICALLEQDVAYLVNDKTNNRTYGKPRMDFIIALLLWVGFNVFMLYMRLNGKKDIFVSYNQVLWIGNIVFGIIFLISFSGFLSALKTVRIFNRMRGQR